MMEQRDQAIQDQDQLAQDNRDYAAACLMAISRIQDVIDVEESDIVKTILGDVILKISGQHAIHERAAVTAAGRAEVLRAHATAAAKGAPYRPVERLGVLTSVRPGKYES